MEHRNATGLFLREFFPLLILFLLFFHAGAQERAPMESLIRTGGELKAGERSRVIKDPSGAPDRSKFISVEDISSGKDTDGVRFLYNYLLDREPDEEGYKKWKEAMERGELTWEQVVFGFVHSEEFKRKSAESNTLYVRGLYLEALMRGVDESGAAYFTGGLDKGIFTREQVRDMIRRSPEYRERGTGALGPSPLQTSSPAPKRQAESQIAAGKTGPGGFRFPVLSAAARFSNDFGTGTHSFGKSPFNVGIDIFAPKGTPLVACVSGTLHQVGQNGLGGNRLHIIADDGTDYYYAHLDSFAPGIRSGMRIEAGQPVGTVGDTGNARGTPPHLHIAAVRNGQPVNLYSILCQTRP